METTEGTPEVTMVVIRTTVMGAGTTTTGEGATTTERIEGDATIAEAILVVVVV